jgi:prepilin-type processing-associated H-X9-DG protein
MAIAALVCGIVGIALTPFCVPVGLVGLILGIIATVRASREPQRYGGKGLAIGGICTGGASVLLALVAIPLIAILLPSLSRAHDLAKRTADAANLRIVGLGAAAYASDNQGLFPPDLQTLLNSGDISARQLVDPSSGHMPPRCDYYYVAGLVSNDPVDWIIAYSDPANHGGAGANILYVDTRVAFEKEPRFTAEVNRFKAEYEKKRGQPPVIVPPR